MINIFIHISKTAGTSLKQVIYNNYALEEIHESYDPKLWHPNIQKDLNGFDWKLILGHIRYGYHENIEGDTQYFTVMRNPVERCYSHFRHFHRSPIEEHKEIAKSYPNISSFSKTDKAYNLQTRIISGVHDVNKFKKDERRYLELAKKNLDKFVCIGLSDRFDESLLLLKDRLDWKRIYYSSSNVDPTKRKTSHLTKEEKKGLQEANQLDIELYKYAQKRFEKDINSIPFFGIKKLLFKQLNSLRNLKLKLMN
tara:strand:+ start:210 stop:968 length:759 start_codon:yes stop_codon:yes gene_type:complete